MKPNTIEFQTTSNTLMDGWVMRITADRRIEVNEDVDVNEAAKKVLEAMQLMLDNQKRTWVGLTDEEILVKCESVPDYDIGNHDLIQFAKAIEAKLKQKNGNA
jgi:predicted NUDIX family phosphoesterase